MKAFRELTILLAMEIARLFSESNKLNGADNYTAWSFKVETMLRRDEVYDEVVLTAPPTTAPTGDDLKLLIKQRVKAISIFQVTVRNHLILLFVSSRMTPTGCGGTFNDGSNLRPFRGS